MTNEKPVKRAWRLAPYDAPEEKGLTLYFNCEAKQIRRLLEVAEEMFTTLKMVQKLNLCDADQINQTHSENCEGCAVELAIMKVEAK